MRSRAAHPNRASKLFGAAALSVTMVGSLAACSPGGQADVPDFDAASLCQKVDTTQSLPHCTAGFTEGSAVRIPQATTSEGTFGVMSGTSETNVALIDASGNSHQLSAGAREALEDKIDKEDVEQLYANIVFYATMQDSAVTHLTPVATVDTAVILSTVFGGRTLEGTISEWDAQAAEYTSTPTLPVQIKLDNRATTVDGRVSLKGTITNATTPATLHTGSTAPALTDAAARNPLQGEFTQRVVIQRFPSMHSLFDDELVLAWGPSSSGMGTEFYPSIATAAGLTTLDGPWEITQHGAPSAGPRLTLDMTK